MKTHPWSQYMTTSQTVTLYILFNSGFTSYNNFKSLWETWRSFSFTFYSFITPTLIYKSFIYLSFYRLIINKLSFVRIIFFLPFSLFHYYVTLTLSVNNKQQFDFHWLRGHTKHMCTVGVSVLNLLYVSSFYSVRETGNTVYKNTQICT